VRRKRFVHILCGSGTNASMVDDLSSHDGYNDSCRRYAIINHLSWTFLVPGPNTTVLCYEVFATVHVLRDPCDQSCAPSFVPAHDDAHVYMPVRDIYFDQYARIGALAGSYTYADVAHLPS
jgi:hypothetical protein